MKEIYPGEWSRVPNVPPQDPINMLSSLTSKLPRVGIKIYYATGILPKKNIYVAIRVGEMGNQYISNLKREKNNFIEWNEEFVYRVELGSDSPFMVQVSLYQAHTMGQDTLL